MSVFILSTDLAYEVIDLLIIENMLFTFSLSYEFKKLRVYCSFMVQAFEVYFQNLVNSGNMFFKNFFYSFVINIFGYNSFGNIS